MSRKPLPVAASSRDDATGRIVAEYVLADHPDWAAHVAIDDSGSDTEIVQISLVRRDLSRFFCATADGSPYVATGSASASMLRSIKLSELVAAGNFHLEAWRSPGRLPDPGKQQSNTPKYYATWAAAYVRAVRSGSRSPNADLAADHGLERSQVRDLIHDCRRKGYLTDGRKGTAGGELTDLALEALGRTKENRQ